jgi:hypothetical protein
MNVVPNHHVLPLDVNGIKNTQAGFVAGMIGFSADIACRIPPQVVDHPSLLPSTEGKVSNNNPAPT